MLSLLSSIPSTSSDTQCSSPLFTPQPGVDSLDADSYVFVLRSFVNETEIMHLRGIAAADARFATATYHATGFFRPWEARATDITRSIEDRIGMVTGIRPNPSDSDLRIAVNRPWRGSLSDSAQHLQNLHHDANERPRRVATVLIYLSDAFHDALEGGETLLPCVRSRHGTNADVCSRLEAGFHAGERFLSPPGGMHSGACFDELAARAASDECVASARGVEPTTGVRITPRRGTAVLFMSASPASGALLPSMWHGGCRVRSGEKWTLQQFKEVPL